MDLCIFLYILCTFLPIFTTKYWIHTAKSIAFVKGKTEREHITRERERKNWKSFSFSRICWNNEKVFSLHCSPVFFFSFFLSLLILVNTIHENMMCDVLNWKSVWNIWFPFFLFFFFSWKDKLLLLFWFIFPLYIRYLF